MDFVSAMRQLMLERILISIKNPDERLKVHRPLRRQQQDLWVGATDDELIQCAREMLKEKTEHGISTTFDQCLAEAQSARSRAQQSLTRRRSW